MKNRTDPLLDRIRLLMHTQQDPFETSHTYFSAGDLLSEVYLECHSRGQLTDAEVVGIIRSKVISAGRESLPMFRSRNYSFDEMEESMRYSIGMSERHSADEDTEVTSLFLEAFIELGIDQQILTLENQK